MDQNAAVQVIANPLGQDISAQISTQLVAPKDVDFHFRSAVIYDDSGKEVIDPKGNGKDLLKKKRASFKAQLPLLTVAGLIAALQAGDKTTELALEMANSAIIDRMRGLITDKVETDPQQKLSLSGDMFNLNDLSFVSIANLPKSERGAGIPKEQWAAFVTDYKQTMATSEAIAMFPDRKPRSSDVLEKHGVLIAGKFNQIRSRKDVLGQMLGFLDIWVQVSQNADEHVACYEHLKSKGQALLQAENFDDL